MIIKKNITRREFCKKAIISLAGLSFISRLPKKLYGNIIRQNGLIFKKEAMWYKKIKEGFFSCGLCPHKCTLRKGMRSICQVREADKNKLYTYAYGNPTAVHVDPIEKKPLFHFLPGSMTFSIATAGCNFSCLNCQNWQISQFSPEETHNYKLMPADVVKGALANRCKNISYTYSEPSIFYEYMLDTAKIAHENNIKNTSVTNGYLNPGPLKEVSKYLDGANVDIKGFTDEFYLKFTEGRLTPVLDGIMIMIENGVFVEITNLVISGKNDSDKMIKDLCHWIIKNPGPHTPIHFSGFTPRYKLKNLQPTPIPTLERARKIAMDIGLNYAYIGNIPTLDGGKTFCHNCHNLIIDRKGYYVKKVNMQNGYCKFCKTKIPGVWS